MGQGGIVEGMLIDVVRLHETWMELVFPRQRTAVHNVLGKWKPRTTGDKIKYKTWGALGVPLVAVLYPLLLVGFLVRFNARRFDSATARLGIFGVVLVTTLIWGALTALAHVRLEFGGFLAVGAASAVAVVSAGLAGVFTRVGGRGTTVFLAYPFAMNAIFLPPVVAALFDPSLGDVQAQSEAFAIFILDNVLYVGGLNDTIRHYFDLEGIGIVLMWVSIATPLGWFLGLVVTLADLIRPRSAAEDEGAEAGPA